MSWIDAVLGAARLAVEGEKDGARVATGFGRTVTAGQVRAAISALKHTDAGAIERAVAGRLANLADDEAAGDEVLKLIATFIPQIGLVAALIHVAEFVIPFVIAQNREHPIVNPEVDANAYRGRGGRGN